MKKTLTSAIAVAALTLGGTAFFAGQSSAGGNSCTVKTTMGEETRTLDGSAGQPSGQAGQSRTVFRWVKTERIRCADGKSITITTRGDYQPRSPFN